MSKSKIFLYFCLSFIVGIGLASFFTISIQAMGIVLILGISLIVVWWRYQWKLVVVGFCFIFIVAGIYRYSSFGENNNGEIKSVSYYNDSKENITISGIIIGEPDARSDNTKYEIEGSSVVFGENRENVNGNILITIEKYPEYSYGDLVEVKGKLNTPKDFTDFSYKDYLGRYGIYSVMYYPQVKLLENNRGNFIYSKILSVKNLFQENINNILPEPHSSFLAGLLLGSRKQIPAGLMEDFNRTGTTHIIAISGYNITIIAVVITGLLLSLGLHRYHAFWISVGGIILFTILTGASASVVRAAVMGILVLIASRLGRLSQATNALILSGVLMVIVNPKILRFDVGFQLSFLATTGLIFISPIFEKISFKKNIPKQLFKAQFIKDSLIATLAAQIFVLPVIVYNFDRLSLISPLANILILPIIPFIMLIGFIGGMVGFVWLSLAKFFGFITWALLSYEIKVIEFLSNVPLASIEIKATHWGWVIFYYALVGAVYYRFKTQNTKLVR